MPTPVKRYLPRGLFHDHAYLSVDDGVQAIDFYKKAFNATELVCMPMPDGKIGHAELGSTFFSVPKAPV
jgi:PhnB protein